MKKELIDDLKALDWQNIIDFGNSLKDLDSAQWRFLKGLIVEYTLETYSDIRYVGEVHRDFEWEKHGVDIELKSQLSMSMYSKKRKKICKTFGFALNNSHGTNGEKELDPSNVADILILVRNDGAIVVDRQTVIDCAVKRGDGWYLKIPSTRVVNLTNCVEQKTVYQNTIQQDVVDLIKKAIPKVSTH